MNTGLKILLGALTTLVLCVGLYLLLFETRITTNMFNVVRDQGKEKEIYQQYYAQEFEEVSYAELVATLLNTLEYDIVIDGVPIMKNEHNSEKITGYNIKDCDYLKEYQYDEKGNIIKISYTSKE